MGTAMDDKEFLAYTAGFFDADGCVGIYTKGEKGYSYPSFRLIVTITQKQWMSIFWDWKERWGGHFSDSSEAWRWQIYSRGACQFLQDVLPHLRVKRDQAKLAIKFQQQMKNHTGKLSDEERGQQRTMSEILKSMKRYDQPVPQELLEKVYKLAHLALQLELPL